MTDKISLERRSWNMSQIKGIDTLIEIRVRKYLFNRGFRYRKNVKDLPGKPDIVLPKYRTVIFVHGCFWHRHSGCKYATMPGTRVEFWSEKFKRNMEKDFLNENALLSMGWKVITLWECEIKNDFDTTMKRVIDQLLHVTD